MESRLQYDDFHNRKVETIVNESHVAEFEARLATQLIERWGIVAAVPDGEDSSGRQTIRLMTPEETVQRAVETAELAVKTFHDKGWMHKMPTFAERDAFREKMDEDKAVKK